jgi:RNA polymerase II-associated factor 1
VTPKPHIHDLPLLRPLNALGKPKSFNDSNVSFLRRTEYISNIKRLDAATLRASRPQKAPPSTLTKLPDADKESPEYILAAVTRSFDTAALNLQNPSRIRHPTKRNLKLVESYTLLPDLAAMPAEPGAYIAVKFAHNPVPPSSTYDTRVPLGILRPLAPTEDAQAAHNRAQALYDRDPSRNPPPEPLQDYEFLLPETARDAEAVKRKLDVMDPERDDEGLYTCANGDGEKCFRYKRVRAYETAQAIDLGTQRWDEEIALGIQEREIDGGEMIKAAWMYPLILKATVRSQRKKNIERLRFGEQEDMEQIIDFLDLRVNEETKEERAAREVFMQWPNGPPESEKEKEAGEDEGAEDAHAEEDVDADAESE